MTIRSLVSESNYKYFFNAVYKNYLKKENHDIVRSFDLYFNNLFKKIFETKIVDCADSNFSIYISSITDFKIDVSVLDELSDELQDCKFFNLFDILNYKIIKSVKLNKNETLAHILWNFKDESI